MNNLSFRLISSANKCFEDTVVSSLSPLYGATALKNDHFAFEAALSSTESRNVFVTLESELSDFITVRKIEYVDVAQPCYAHITDPDYLNGKKPGRYPDLFLPLGQNGRVTLCENRTVSFWIEAKIPKDAQAGLYPITLSVSNADGKTLASETVELEILDAVLPTQKLMYTEWFHSDCLATYYGVDVFSEAHWRIIENFVKTAVDNGINMLLMPVFTLPLDTKVGGERPTTQLVGVTKTADGYEFDFSLVGRWLDMCERCGVKYHEISHLFTQWGAEHAPKIMATVNGSYVQLFGWDTDSLSDEYIGFLRAFLAKFKNYLKEKGVFQNVMFHLSDEPVGEHLERYKKLREKLDDLFTDCVFGDALSNFDFYTTGAVDRPIVGTDHIEPFLEAKVPNLWCYYCCSQSDKVSNRFIAHSMNRTRVIGLQLFKYDIQGFLQWGYNFYYSQYSLFPIDPYLCNDGCFNWVPAGDAFSVYPGPGGKPYESLHMAAFTQGLSDLRALELYASLTSKEEAVSLIESFAGAEITFKEYPRREGFCVELRERINRAIKLKIEN